jgi:uncharacterized DUF497 family protein
MRNDLACSALLKSIFNISVQETASKAGMELPDADLKIGDPWKWQHFQKDFFYRLVLQLKLSSSGCSSGCLTNNYKLIMKKLIFEWDDKKNASNIRKHSVSFEEAQTVFFDENAIEFDDPDHSIQEESFILLGLSQSLKVLVVCHCYRSHDLKIRIISARKATKKEQGVYSRRS